MARTPRQPRPSPRATPSTATRRRRGPQVPHKEMAYLIQYHEWLGQLPERALAIAWRALLRQARRGVAAALSRHGLAPFVAQVPPPPVSVREAWERDLVAAVAASGDITTDAAGRSAARTIADRVMGAFVGLVRWFARGVGAHWYLWTTTGDQRVRPLHRELNGTRQSWDDPPVCGTHGFRGAPGEPAGCRCVAVPTI